MWRRKSSRCASSNESVVNYEFQAGPEETLFKIGLTLGLLVRFGCRTRGNAPPDSDVDLGVLPICEPRRACRAPHPFHDAPSLHSGLLRKRIVLRVSPHYGRKKTFRNSISLRGNRGSVFWGRSRRVQARHFVILSGHVGHDQHRFGHRRSTCPIALSPYPRRTLRGSRRAFTHDGIRASTEVRSPVRTRE